jgi:hypothetical protein
MAKTQHLGGAKLAVVSSPIKMRRLSSTRNSFVLSASQFCCAIDRKSLPLTAFREKAVPG